MDSMTDKPKRDIVTTAMRERLLANRDGRLLKDQWLDLVTEPLIVLLILLPFAAVILGPRFTAFAVSLPGGVILLLALLALTAPLVLRARRYARAPLHFEVLYSPRFPSPFWRPQVLVTDEGREMRFGKRLAPHMPLRPEHPYLVYYLEDAGRHVLLSCAPADHPDAEHWYPTKSFDLRFTRRTAR